MNFTDDAPVTPMGYAVTSYNFTGVMLEETTIKNSTVDDTTPANKAQFLLYDILVPGIGTVIMLMNLAVVISSGLILKKGQQPRSTYLFLGNVAMTDFITGLAVVFGQVFPREYRDHYICSVQIGMIVSSTLTSVYSVGLIAIDRFLYILHGLQYQKWVYPTRARLLICFIWILGCIVGYLPLFGWYRDTENGKYCWFIRLAPKELTVLTVIVGAIPIIIVVILYSIILYHAIKRYMYLKKSDNRTQINTTSGQRNLRMFRGRPPPSLESQEKPEEADRTKNGSFFARVFKKKPSSSVSSPKKWKAIKIVLFTTSSFVITWTPYFVVSLIYAYTCEETRDSKRCKNISLLIASPLAILGFINSLLNPIIYAWWHKGFRTYVKKRMSTIMRRRTRNDFEPTRSKTTSTKSSVTQNTQQNRVYMIAGNEHQNSDNNRINGGQDT